MKNHKQALIMLAVGVFIIPQFVLAAWWNPFSWNIWNIFRPTTHVKQVQTETATPTTPTVAKEIDISTKQEEIKNNNVPPSVSQKKQTNTESNQTVTQQNSVVLPSVPVVKTSEPTSVAVPSCTEDLWDCSDWLDCSSSGSQVRTCNKAFDCSSVDTPSPRISQSCTPPSPTCQSDTWECGNWNSCSASGNQTRSCLMTFDCSVANTPSPSTSQSCTPPSAPPSNPVTTYSDYNFSYTYSYQYPDPEWIKRFKVAETSRNLRITKAVFRITDEDAEKYDSITSHSQPPRLRFCKQQCQMYTLERTDKNTFIYVGSQTGGVPIAEGYIYLEIPIPAYAEGMITNFSIPTSEWEIWDGTTGKPVDM